MTEITHPHRRINHRTARAARPATLTRAMHSGAAAAFGVLLGVTVEELTTRD